MPHKSEKGLGPSENFKRMDKEVRPNSPQGKQTMLDTFSGEIASSMPGAYETGGHPKQMNFLERFLNDQLGSLGTQEGYVNPLTGGIRVHPNLLSDTTKEEGLRKFLTNAYTQSGMHKSLSSDPLRHLLMSGGIIQQAGQERGSRVKPRKDIELKGK